MNKNKILLMVVALALLSSTPVYALGPSQTNSSQPLPVASFSYSPANPSPHSSVLFNASESYPLDRIVNYLWDYGDSSKPSYSLQPFGECIYDEEGVYNVTMTVLDVDRQTSSYTLTIFVRGNTPKPQPNQTVYPEMLTSTDAPANPAPLQNSTVFYVNYAQYQEILNQSPPESTNDYVARVALTTRDSGGWVLGWAVLAIIGALLLLLWRDLKA